MGELWLDPAYRTRQQRQRLAAADQRLAVMQRPAAQREQCAGGVIGGKHGSGQRHLSAWSVKRTIRLKCQRANFLPDPAVDRGRGDGVGDVPVGPRVLEADRRPQQPDPRKYAGRSVLNRFHGEQRFADPGLTARPACVGGCYRRRDGPAEARLPDQIGIADARSAGIAVAQFAKMAGRPGRFAIGAHHAHIGGGRHGCRRKKLDVTGARRHRRQRQRRDKGRKSCSETRL